MIRKIGDSTKLRWIAVAALLGGLLWSYWPTLSELWAFWQLNPDYSVGQLVPLVAVYLVWADRKALRKLPVRVCWWGLGVVLSAQAVRLFGLLYMYGSLERYSLVLTVGGTALLVFGYAAVRRLIYVFAFLMLMVPLPNRVHNDLALPLQNFAANSAVFGLELLGYLVDRRGNVLRLSDQTAVAVAEACSGLRMLTAFVVVAATLAFVVRRPPWQKAVVVLSSLPVAILANTLRLIATVLLYESAGSQVAERFFHDFAGLTMMPFAIVVLMAELWMIRRLSMGATGASVPAGEPA